MKLRTTFYRSYLGGYSNELLLRESQLDVPLSSMGIKQAELLGRRLELQKFTHVFTSDLSRAKQTAACIMENNKNTVCQITEDPRLRERKYGIAEGKSFSFVREASSRAGQLVVSYTPPGGETLSQVRHRATSFFRELCDSLAKNCVEKSSGHEKHCHGDDSDEFPAETCQNVGYRHKASTDSTLYSPDVKGNAEHILAEVLVVSHGGLLRELVCHLAEDLGCHVPGGRCRCLCPNGAVSSFWVTLPRDGLPSVVCEAFHDQRHLAALRGQGCDLWEGLSEETTAL